MLPGVGDVAHGNAAVRTMFLSGGRIGCGIHNSLALAQACLRMGRDTRNQHEPAQKDSQKKAVIHTAPVFLQM
jgi:hypothetical protein